MTSTATVRSRASSAGRPARWGRFGAVILITAVVLAPLASTLGSALGLPFGPGGGGRFGPGPSEPWALRELQSLASWLQPPAITWFGNSLMLAFATIVVCVLVGAPAAYALSRGRSRFLSGFAVGIFAVQSFPIVLTVIPLFLLFARIGLVDTLFGVGLVYISVTIAVVIWMLSAYIDSIPIELEEAAWLDGCSVLGAFFRVVLRNSLPGILSASIFGFIFVWNDYLIALTFLRSNSNYTLGIGLEAAGHSPALTLVMALPPVLIFVLLNRYFSIGGVGGSLAGR